MVLVLQTKLDFWNRLPWVLCGLALQWDVAGARRCGQAALDGMEREGRKVLHSRQTLPWLSGELHDDLKRFVDGASYQQCSPMFRLKVAEFLLVPTDETFIEQPHAATSVKAKGASHFDAVAISLSNRWPAVDAILRRPPVSLSDFLECMDRARCWRFVPSALGLDRHPHFFKAARKIHG